MYKEETSMEFPEVVDHVQGEERSACWATIFREMGLLRHGQLVAFFVEGRSAWLLARFINVSLDPMTGFLFVRLPSQVAPKRIPFRLLVGFKRVVHEGYLEKKRRTLDLSESFS